MLENKKLNMILSLIIAIALWAFVIGEVNPEATRVYREIPIQLINEEVLDDSGLAVLSVSDTTMSITLTGTRSEINQIDAKDIVATVDLEQAALGDNQLKIDIKVPSKVEIETQSLNKVTLIVEEKVAKDVDVNVRYNGTFAGEEEPITIEKSLQQVTVTGAASNVNRVAAVDAIVEEGTVTAEMETFDCNLIPVDKNGLQVLNVELSEDNVQVTAELAKTKTVPLKVSIIEEENTTILRTVTVPETIIVKGRSADLEKIKSISTEAISLNDVMETTTLPIIPILPENVELSDENEALVVVVRVTKLQSKTFTFDAADVVLDNLAEGFRAEVKGGTIEITVTGSADVINSLSQEALVLSADLTGFEAGEHKVELHAACTIENVSTEVKPQSITVAVEPSPVEEENKEDDHNVDNNVSIEE